MAETGEAIEMIEQGQEALEGEGEKTGEEDMTEEDREELDKEVKEVKSNVEKLAEVAKKFKGYATEFAEGPAKEFAKFVVKNVAIGTIFYGVNVTLSKLIKKGGSGGETESNKNKLAVVKAITTIIQTETTMCNNIKDWIEQHKHDTINLDGVEIPVASVFFKYMDPISDAVDQAFKVAKPLQKKIEGNVEWSVPNAEDISALLNASEAFVTSFDNLFKFVVENNSKIPLLKSVPVKQADIDDLNDQLETVKKMPFY
ncbi:uncharacterized protein LOC117103309 [Anneissia japonica]|uniref:uncharacterized protein LOC117103309 n=1 Tax=Anneissia japonica TaxID=1529436 RepID=UPI001425687C|nr:uncharacterized protein LOC117103309 [Anneissia japonica]